MNYIVYSTFYKKSLDKERTFPVVFQTIQATDAVFSFSKKLCAMEFELCILSFEF